MCRRLVLVIYFIEFRCLNKFQGTRNAPAPRPNKRRRVDPSSMGTDPQPLLKTAQLSQFTKENNKLKEFMAVMQPMKGPAWVNEAPAQPPLTQESGIHEGKPQEPLSDLEWMRQRMSKHVDQEDRVFDQSDEELQDRHSVCFCIFLYILS